MKKNYESPCLQQVLLEAERFCQSGNWSGAGAGEDMDIEQG